MQKNENRPGYKKTTLGEIVAFKSGGTPRKTNPSFWGGEYPWVSAKDLKVLVISGSLDTLTESGFKKSKIAPKNALLILVRGMTLHKKVPVCLAGRDLAFNQDLKALIPSAEVLSKFLLSYLLAKESSLLHLVDFAGNGTGRLDTDLLKTLSVSLPPLPEQEAIAGVLECWDKSIRTLEKKIEKKRLIKKGLMQKLLSGRTRLPSFSKDWKSVSLGDVFSFVKSHAFSRECLTTADVENANIYNIHYGDIHATYDGCIVDLNKEVRVPVLKTGTELPKSTAFLQDGDLVMADASEDYEGVGACIELIGIDGKEVTGGLHTFVLRDIAGETSIGFRGYMFSEYELAKELKRISTGVSVHGISKTNLAKIELTLPPLGEQQAIAEVLSAADGEIEALDKKLALWKDQKKYLLNNLVTGTIRLPEFR